MKTACLLIGAFIAGLAGGGAAMQYEKSRAPYYGIIAYICIFLCMALAYAAGLP